VFLHLNPLTGVGALLFEIPPSFYRICCIFTVKTGKTDVAAILSESTKLPDDHTEDHCFNVEKRITSY
jgi:hypothetical protein